MLFGQRLFIGFWVSRTYPKMSKCLFGHFGLSSLCLPNAYMPIYRQKPKKSLSCGLSPHTPRACT